MNFLRFIFAAVLCTGFCSAAYAQVSLAENGPDRRTFTIAGSRNVAAICYDREDAAVVKTAADLLASDIEKVTGIQPALFDSHDAVSGTGYAIITGTIGSSSWIDSLIEKGKIDVSAIKGGWERYAVRLVDNPGKGVRKAIVIALRTYVHQPRDRRQPVVVVARCSCGAPGCHCRQCH